MIQYSKDSQALQWKDLFLPCSPFAHFPSHDVHCYPFPETLPKDPSTHTETNGYIFKYIPSPLLQFLHYMNYYTLCQLLF